MGQFTGRGGSLLALGEPFEFQVYLEDCGDGWDWRAPRELRYWLPDGLSFEVRSGDRWRGAGMVEVHHRSGRVGFDRCLRGMVVRATGVCRPVSEIGVGERWQLNVETVVRNASALGDEAPTTRSRVLGCSAAIHGIFCETEETALAWLPVGETGAFVGSGQITGSGDIAVNFDQEGVLYVDC